MVRCIVCQVYPLNSGQSDLHGQLTQIVLTRPACLCNHSGCYETDQITMQLAWIHSTKGTKFLEIKGAPSADKHLQNSDRNFD